MKQQDRRTGIYLLPNLLTTASLFAAFFSIAASMKGQFESSVLAIFSALVTDALDGRIARLTQTQTAFGAEYDSLSDVVAFGVAPALLAYTYGLSAFGKIGWLICFMYTAAVALRLARFNTQLDVVDKRYFQGLPCPSAAALVAAFIWVCVQESLSHPVFVIILGMLMLVAGIAMVSNIRYYSFKEMDTRGKIPFLYLLFIVILFVAIAMNPSVMFLVSFVGYILSGPIQTLVQVHRVRQSKVKYKKRLSIVKIKRVK